MKKFNELQVSDLIRRIYYDEIQTGEITSVSKLSDETPCIFTNLREFPYTEEDYGRQIFDNYTEAKDYYLKDRFNN